jgi:hypothetical protein
MFEENVNLATRAANRQIERTVTKKGFAKCAKPRCALPKVRTLVTGSLADASILMRSDELSS